MVRQNKVGTDLRAVRVVYPPLWRENGPLLLLLLAAASTARADEPDEPGFHFFVVPSPANRCHVVQTVRPWHETASVAQFGRLQVFATETGQELWRLDGVLCRENGVFPADDGEHLILVRDSVRGGKDPTDMARPVILFYTHGQLSKSYSLGDLHIDPAKLQNSVSSTHWIATESNTQTWVWDWPPDSEQAEIHALTFPKPNPHWQRGIFELTALDGQTFRFDPITGGQLPEAGK